MWLCAMQGMPQDIPGQMGNCGTMTGRLRLEGEVSMHAPLPMLHRQFAVVLNRLGSGGGVANCAVTVLSNQLKNYHLWREASLPWMSPLARGLNPSCVSSGINFTFHLLHQWRTSRVHCKVTPRVSWHEWKRNACQQ